MWFSCFLLVVILNKYIQERTDFYFDNWLNVTPINLMAHLFCWVNFWGMKSVMVIQLYLQVILL